MNTTTKDTAHTALELISNRYRNEDNIQINTCVFDTQYGIDITVKDQRGYYIDRYDRTNRKQLNNGVRVIHEDEGYLKIMKFENGWVVGTARFEHNIPMEAIYAIVASWI